MKTYIVKLELCINEGRLAFLDFAMIFISEQQKESFDINISKS